MNERGMGLVLGTIVLIGVSGFGGSLIGRAAGGSEGSGCGGPVDGELTEAESELRRSRAAPSRSRTTSARTGASDSSRSTQVGNTAGSSVQKASDLGLSLKEFFTPIPGDRTAGEALFKDRCKACHGGAPFTINPSSPGKVQVLHAASMMMFDTLINCYKIMAKSFEGELSQVSLTCAEQKALFQGMAHSDVRDLAAYIGSVDPGKYSLNGNIGQGGVTVRIIGQVQPSFEILSDAQGVFSISNLVAGEYTIVPDYQGQQFVPSHRKIMLDWYQSTISGVSPPPKAYLHSLEGIDFKPAMTIQEAAIIKYKLK